MIYLLHKKLITSSINTIIKNRAWGLRAFLYQSLIATTLLANIFIRMTSCSDIMRNLFTRMIS